MIHVNKCPVGTTNLRLEPAGKNWGNQYSAEVRWAKDYEI
jgi:hypothetical protein